MRTRDYQKQRVYDFQFVHLYKRDANERLSPAEVIDLVGKVWRRYGAGKPPEVTFRLKRQNVAATAYSHFAIDFYCKASKSDPSPTVRKGTVLHELAHCLNSVGGGDDHHGPRFVGILFDLIRLFTDVDTAEAKRAYRGLPAGRRIKMIASRTAASVRRGIAKYRIEQSKSKIVVKGFDISPRRRLASIESTPAGKSKLSYKQRRHAAKQCVDCGAQDANTLAGRYQCAACKVKRAEWRAKRKEAKGTG